MKKALFIAIVLLCCSGVLDVSGTFGQPDNGTRERFHKAVICYGHNNFSDEFFCWPYYSLCFREGSVLKQRLEVTSPDTLDAIYELIDTTGARLLEKKKYHDIDDGYYYDYDYPMEPWIGILLYFERHVDTVALPRGPLDKPGHYRYQYQDRLKRGTDTKLFDYITHYIRDKDPIWKEINESCYYEDGRYHEISKEFYEDF